MQKTAAETAKEGASRLKKFMGATTDENKKAKPDMVKRIQEIGKAEAEKNEKKKAIKKTSAIEPEPGFVQKMINKYWHGKK